MPRIGETAVNQASFGFSRQRLADFQASEYTLVELHIDCSGTMAGFESQVEVVIQNVIEACRRSPRAGNLLVRVVLFASGINEVHPYKLLKEIRSDEYSGVIRCGGMTSLRDTTRDMFSSIASSAKTMRDADYEVNAIGFVITDGEDTSSTSGPQQVMQACKDLVASEVVDSYRSIIISINNADPRFHSAMQQFASQCGFDQVVDVGNATPAALAKLGDFVSQSISSQSSSLGTGAPSQPVTF